jgi:hypothetical protein
MYYEIEFLSLYVKYIGVGCSWIIIRKGIIFIDKNNNILTVGLLLNYYTWV